MAEKSIEKEDIEKQKKIERQKKLAEKRKLEEANLSEEEKQKRLKERKKAALQKKLEGLSEEEKQKVLEERKKRARQKRLEEQEKQRKAEASPIVEEKVQSNNSKEGDTSVANMEEKNNMKNNSKKTKPSKLSKKIQKENKKQSKLKNKKEKKKMGKAAKIIIVIILILLIATGIFVGKRIKDNGGGMQGIVATMLGHDASTLEKLPELRFLIIGQSQNLTDTIMVCSYNPRSQKASILSIPRDTYTGNNKSRATPYEKINTLYGQSPEKLLKEVNELTGLDIKYYVHVDTDGLVDLVDAVGGVEFDVPINMNYDDSSQKLSIHLKAGKQMLDGNKAEQLVRFRHNNNGTTYPSEYGQEDIGRMKTQREFIKAVIKKMAKAENITKVDDFIVIANKYVKTNMDFNSFKDYAPYALSFNADNVRTETLPGVSEKINGYWFYESNKKETQALVTDMFSLEPVDDVKISDETQNTTDTSNVNVKGVKVEILNGTSNSKNLSNLKTTLQKAGFTVSKTGTTSKTTKTTIVNRTGKSDEIAQKLKSTVGAGAISTGSNNSGVDFTIVIGSDFQE